MEKTVKSGYKRFPQHVIVKAPGLLPMLYKVRELADELGMPERTLRDWLKAGAPYQRDARGRYWINGKRFAEWVDGCRRKKRKAALKDDEAYCLGCKGIVKLKDAKIVPIKGELVHFRGICEHCGNTINRGGRRGASGYLLNGKRTLEVSRRSAAALSGLGRPL